MGLESVAGLVKVRTGDLLRRVPIPGPAQLLPTPIARGCRAASSSLLDQIELDEKSSSDPVLTMD